MPANGENDKNYRENVTEFSFIRNFNSRKKIPQILTDKKWGFRSGTTYDCISIAAD
ncbi:MAG: hypothetical protein GY750_08320 [Lentisphaerae bacterium]|nr:hypothetical protein [Lentisphaerota bacterium]